MFNKAQETKTAKLARLKNTGKFGCTVSVFNMSVVIVVRLFRSFSFCSMCSASPSYAMHGNNLIACHNLTPNRTAYPLKVGKQFYKGQICHATLIMKIIKQHYCTLILRFYERQKSRPNKGFCLRIERLWCCPQLRRHKLLSFIFLRLELWL